jgi:hypothetical protein
MPWSINGKIMPEPVDSEKVSPLLRRLFGPLLKKEEQKNNLEVVVENLTPSDKIVVRKSQEEDIL